MKNKICPVLVDDKESGIQKWESMNVLAVTTPIFQKNARHRGEPYKRAFSFAAIVVLRTSAAWKSTIQLGVNCAAKLATWPYS